MCVAVGVLCAAGYGGYAQTIRHVWTNSPYPAHPYDSWTNAARSIQEAIDAADAGDLIWVTNGVYDTGGKPVPSLGAVPNRVAIDKPVVVASVNGASCTVIKGRKDPDSTNGPLAVRCVYMTNGSALIGFTLTNGATASDMPYLHGGGVWCESSDCVISNCLITGNTAYHRGGGAYGGTLFYCVMNGNSAYYGGGAHDSDLYYCKVRGNFAKKFGGGARGGSLYDCEIIGNSAERGGGTHGGTMYHCTIKGNVASSQGGGAYLSEMYNCVVIGNVLAWVESGGIPKGIK